MRWSQTSNPSIKHKTDVKMLMARGIIALYKLGIG